MFPGLTVLIFIVVLFMYIHITAQWKTSDDLEVYEADYKSIEQMQEICSVKQPVLFQVPKGMTPLCDKFQLAKMEKYDNYDVRIKDARDYASDPASSIDWVVLPLRSAQRLVSTDSGGKYFSESNGDFMEDTGLDAAVGAKMDAFLRPPLAVHAKYDLLFGAAQAALPLRYHISDQKFLVVCGGKIHVKMAPPKYAKTLRTIKDYDNYEFRSATNIHSPSAKDTLDKVKFLDFDIYAGTALFIPPYWWYSIRYSGDPNTTVFSAQYDTVAGFAAHSRDLIMYLLQQSNTKTVWGKTLDINANTGASSGATTGANAGNTIKSSIEIRESIDAHDIPSDAGSPPPKMAEAQGNKEIVSNAGVFTVSGQA